MTKVVIKMIIKIPFYKWTDLVLIQNAQFYGKSVLDCFDRLILRIFKTSIRVPSNSAGNFIWDVLNLYIHATLSSKYILFWILGKNQEKERR